MRIYILGILGAFFSTLLLLYISMATMFGPFIAPVLVLVASILFRADIIHKDRRIFEHKLAIFQAIGSVGGMIAIGVGFTLPTLYFLIPEEFNRLLNDKVYFFLLVGGIVLIAGLLGLWLGRLFSKRLLDESNLRFPVSVMIHENIVAQDHASDARLLIKGSLFSWVTCMVRDGFRCASFSIPSLFSWFGLSKNMVLFPTLFGKEFVFSVMPMVWAIGFTAGFSIVIPLMVGALSKYLIVYPLNMHTHWLPWTFFKPLSQSSFLTAFCSGLVLAELCNGFAKYPQKMQQWLVGRYQEGFEKESFFGWFEQFADLKTEALVTEVAHWYDRYEGFIVSILSVAVLWGIGFSLPLALFVVIGTFFVTYNICAIAGKIGLVTFGRFVTFIMIPALFIFQVTSFQVTMLSLFVAVAMAAASNFLFSAKIGDLQNISRHDMHRYTLLGIIASAIIIGFALWLLCTNFELGSAELFAQRARSRALLISSFHFDWYIVGLGFLYGYALRFFRLSPTMVFGGLLMPNNLTLGLLLGATVNHFVYQGKSEHPFWSGMLTGDTLWEFFTIACKMLG